MIGVNGGVVRICERTKDELEAREIKSNPGVEAFELYFSRI